MPDLSGFEEFCRLVICDAGYQPVDGKCEISVCSNGAMNAPHCDNCNPSSVMQNNQCVAQVCTPNQSYDNCLIVEHGKTKRVCNKEGTGYGACELYECEAGYQIEGLKCVEVAKQGACSNGVNNPPLCDTCDQGKNYNGSVCLSQVCEPKSEASCEIAGGVDKKICNDLGSGYGSSILVECDQNHTRSGNTCIPNTQKPPATRTPTPTPQLASCNLYGRVIAHGGSITAYQSSSVPFGQTCKAETRSCDNGQMSGTYTNIWCTVQPGSSGEVVGAGDRNLLLVLKGTHYQMDSV